MRTARLVGLSPDGRSLVVVTDDGEELMVMADARLRAAVRGDRPRLGQLEIQMESSLSPRDIQARIRSGASAEEVAESAGMPLDRVERFAAPVLAERGHVAATALSSSVRRRGETSGHRILRVTVAERLADRGVDADTLDWDSSRREDGRWAVTVDYRVGEEDRHAEFLYDVQGRYSVAGNDEARWLLGEHLGADRVTPLGLNADAEPTVELDDELALVRATREPPAEVETVLADAATDEPAEAPADPDAAGPAGPAGLVGAVDDASAGGPAGPVHDRARLDESAEPTVAVVRRLTAVELTEVEVVGDDRSEAGQAHSALDTLYDMLGGDGYAEESTRVYAGLSDASAVPVVDEHDFEPAPPAVDFPVEPSEDEEGEDEEGKDEAREDGAREDPGVEADQTEGQRDAEVPGPDEQVPEPEAVDSAPSPAPGPAAPVEEDEDALIPGPAAPKKPVKRKRASVPSWDEIMFGGPKR